ncbi:MAG: PAS domain S-box protein [Anaerolineales bacterium]|nr:PAS domain S-box protein [Anaerolineales bacterium]
MKQFFWQEMPLADRIRRLQYILPFFLVATVVFNQLVVARWLQETFGHLIHYSAEILLYATIGPLVTFGTLKLIGGWLEEKDQAEKLAQSHERRLASITSASADAILSLDSHRLIESWNRGAELLFGYEASEILGLSFSILLEGEEAAEIEMNWLEQTVQQEGFVRGHETICRDRNNRSITTELTATSLINNLGEMGGMSIILRDITNRKRREAEINHLNENLNIQVAERTKELAIKMEELAQANSSLQKLDQTRSEFVSLVSHQIRAPLTNMNGAIQRMRVDCGTIAPTCRRMFMILDQQVTRLDRLVEDVLDVSRLETGEISMELEPISMLPLVRQIVEQTQVRMTERSVQIMDKPGLPLVFADRDRIADVLTNLLDNADKYSPPETRISVELGADQDEVTLSVRDHGSGLSFEDQQHVFEKFYRADSSDSQAAYGYGLGLYLCQRMVQALGGRIWAENHPDGGAIFSFSIPVWHEHHVK